MRTEQQVKTKLNELKLQQKRLQDRLNVLLPEQEPQRKVLDQQLEKLGDMAIMLEWVLDAPSGSYHM